MVVVVVDGGRKTKEQKNTFICGGPVFWAPNGAKIETHRRKWKKHDTSGVIISQAQTTMHETNPVISHINSRELMGMYITDSGTLHLSGDCKTRTLTLLEAQSTKIDVWAGREKTW